MQPCRWKINPPLGSAEINETKLATKLFNFYFLDQLHLKYQYYKFTNWWCHTCMTSASFPLKAYSGDMKSKSGRLASLDIDAAACNSFYRTQNYQIHKWHSILRATFILQLNIFNVQIVIYYLWIKSPRWSCGCRSTGIRFICIRRKTKIKSKYLKLIIE